MTDDVDPIAFALAFVHAMRKRKDLSHVPSVRTAVALPRFLTARRFRTGALTPADLVAAAVLLTPLEDQSAAFETARGIVFKREQPRDAKAPDASEAKSALAGPIVATVDDSKRDDDAPSILEDLAGLNLDLGALDLGTLDALLDQKIADATEMKSLDLMGALSTSGDAQDEGLAELATTFGGAAELEAAGVHEKGALKRMLLERLFGQLGALDPETAVQAAKAGFTDDVIDDVTVPWERAALLAASGEDDHAGELDTLLDGVMQGGDAKEIGRTLRYLREAAPPARVKPFRARALASVRHLADWAEIVDGMGTFEEPPDDLVASSAVENLPRTLLAAGALELAFKQASKLDAGDDDDAWDADDDESVGRQLAGAAGTDDAEDVLDFDDANERAPPPPRADLRHTAFGAWAAQLQDTPSLDFLLEVFVPVDHWHKLARLAFADIVRDLDAARPLEPDARMERIRAALPLGPRLLRTRSDPARQLAAELATAVLVFVNDRARFLPLLDALVDAKLMPHDGNAVVAAGVALGLSEEDILARLSQPLEQLRFLIEGNIQDLKRHLELVDKIDHVPEDLLAHLVQCCVRDKNLMGLALLLAIALGPTLLLAPQEMSDGALQYKGIGGGENLLLQWYLHRDSLPSAFKDRVKALAKHALLEAALPWMHKGAGGAERGLIPQSRTRPYRAGDETESIDIEGTLELLATSGKTPEQMSTDDLVVHDTSGGRAGFGVLIDISGSMTGKDLAVCAIAVVMLLGRLKPEEIAIALFESNTHVVKTFAQARELDDVAGDLLELRATGGTRVDAALQFIADEFASQPEVERRVLFLLSDFMFFEDAKELAPHLERLAHLSVRFLGAAHGHFDKPVAQSFVDVIGGQVSKLASIEKLPDTLLQALAWIGDGAE